MNRRDMIQKTAGVSLVAGSGVQAGSLEVWASPTRPSASKMKPVPVPAPCIGTHKDLEQALRCTNPDSQWWLHASGDTIKEKCDHLYLSVHNIIFGLTRVGAAGNFYIVTSPEIASIFETASFGFKPRKSLSQDELHSFQKTNDIVYSGVFQNRFRLYTCYEMPVNQILVGTEHLSEAASKPDYFAQITIDKFI